MKPEKAKPEHEIKKIMEEKEKNLFVICERCGQTYEDMKNLPVKCNACGACLLCLN
jgi:DNA-directed RNA polymerase subunit RPC12/RpoP